MATASVAHDGLQLLQGARPEVVALVFETTPFTDKELERVTTRYGARPQNWPLHAQLRWVRFLLSPTHFT